MHFKALVQFFTCIEPYKGGNTSLTLSSVSSSLGVGGPAHPLVVEDRVGPHLVSHYHCLEGVGLKKIFE